MIIRAYNNLELLDRSVKWYSTYEGEENVNMGGKHSERTLEDEVWIDLAQDRDKRRVLVNMAIKLCVLKMWAIS